MSSPPFGSTTRTVVPFVVSLLMTQYQVSPSVAAASSVCVKAALAPMTFPLSETPRIVFEERAS